MAGPRRPQDRVRPARPEGVVPQGAALAAARRGAAARRRTPRGRQRRRGRGRGVGRRRPGVAGRSRRDGGGRRRRARPRLGGDRRDHQLHQHLEPVGDAGRGAARQEGGRAGSRAQALGEDLARPGLEGGHRLLPAVGAPALPGRARLQPRGLRLHDLHRQLGAAAEAIADEIQPRGPRGLRGALRQPQLRGPDQLRRARELPDVAAAGGRVRARRPDRHGPRHRAAGDGYATGGPSS